MGDGSGSPGTPSSDPFPTLTDHSLTFADFDADGDLDGYAVGTNSTLGFSLYYSLLFKNGGDGTFVDSGNPLPQLTLFEEISGPSVSWADIDSDRRLDFILIARVGTSSSTATLHANTLVASNTPPLAPEDLASTVSSDGTVSLSWNAGAGDTQTPDNALTFEILLGTASSVYEMSAALVTSSGSKLYPARGSVQGGFQVLTSLSAGTYYWTVFSVDSQFAVSPVAAEDIFVVGSSSEADITWFGVPGEVDEALIDATAHTIEVYIEPGDLVVPDFSLSRGATAQVGSADQIPGITSQSFPGDVVYLVTAEDGTTTQQWTVSASYDPFSAVDLAGVGGLYLGDMTWADYDLDGDPDLLVTGTSDGSAGATSLYRNDSSGGSWSFTPVHESAFEPLLLSDAAWGDYDNDGDPDLALTGSPDGSTAVTKVYRNDLEAVPPVFVEVFPGVFGQSRQGSVAWGDINSDGLLDLLVTGTTDGMTGSSRLYQQSLSDGTRSFSQVHSGVLPGVFGGRGIFADLDVNGYTDIILTGASSPTARITSLYYNDGTSLTARHAGQVDGAVSADLDVADYDSDGDLDIMIAGEGTGGLLFTRLFRNNLASGFDTPSGITFPGLQNPSVAWGDYDNDGDADLILTGWNPSASAAQSTIYENTSGTFSATVTQLEGITNGRVAWVDVNADTVLDLSLLGQGSDASPAARLLLGEIDTPNTKVSACQNLVSDVDPAGTVTLSWDAGVDGETPRDGLSFDVLIGDASGNYNRSPAPPAADGSRFLLQRGAREAAAAIFRDLPKGTTWYWRVQAVDTGLRGGELSQEAQFYIPSDQTVLLSFQIPTQILPSQIDLDTREVRLIVPPPFDNIEFTFDLSPGATLTLEDVLQESGVSTHDFSSPSVFRVLAEDGVTFQDYTVWVEPPPFVRVSTPAIAALSSGTAKWVDLDGDEDLDLSVTGSTRELPPQPFFEHYLRDGNFSASGSPSGANIHGQALDWGDYDLDGDLDLIECGKDDAGEPTLVVHRQETGGSFAQISPSGVPGYTDCAVLFWDSDHDMDLDLLVAGRLNALEAAATTNLYLNDGSGAFTLHDSVSLPGVKSPDMAIGDLNADGYSDLILAGEQTDGSRATRTYLNNQAEGLVSWATPFDSVESYSVRIADLNGDGYPDVVLAGTLSAAQSYFGIWINQGGTSFSEQLRRTALFVDERFGVASPADVNQDGYPDIPQVVLSTGSGSTERLRFWYRSVDPATSTVSYRFEDSETLEINSGLNILGDSDADGDLDLFSTGSPSDTDPNAYYYQSLASAPNLPPDPPTNLSTTHLDNRVILLSWVAAGDDTTPAAAMTYDVLVARSAGALETTPNLVPVSHRRRFARAGRIHATFFPVRGLAEGTHFFSVQAVDAGLAGSALPDAFSFQVVYNEAILTDFALDGQVGEVTIDQDSGSIQVGALISELSSMVATFSLSPGATLEVGGVDQVSGTSVQDYSSPVTLTVISEDRLVRNMYSVDVEALIFGPILEGVLPGVQNGDIAVLDYNKDGWIDLALVGEDSAGNPVAGLYQNNMGTSISVVSTNPIHPSGGGAVSAGDFNNDGNPDLLTCGEASYGLPRTRLYLGDGIGGFTNLDSPYTLQHCNIMAFDADNDGFEDDFLLNGKNLGDTPNTIFVQATRSFSAFTVVTPLGRGLRDVLDGHHDAGDYDADGYKDLLISGTNAGGNPWTGIYHNESGASFSFVTVPTLMHLGGPVRWFHLDSDGHLDIFQSGETAMGPLTQILRGDGSGGFTSFAVPFSDFRVTQVEMIDIDGNGWTDLAMSVLDSGSPGLHIYRYDEGAGTFEPYGPPLPGLSEPSLKFADLDNDKNPDLVVLGQDSDGVPQTVLYKNYGLTPNQAPDPPTALTSTIGPDTVSLYASGAVDTRTASVQISYDFFLGTSPGAYDRIPPYGPASGFRSFSRPGRVYSEPFILNRLPPPGTYYWAAQAVDTGFLGSEFSDERSFLIPSTETGFLSFTVAEQIGTTEINEGSSTLVVQLPIHLIGPLLVNLTLSNMATVTLEGVIQPEIGTIAIDFSGASPLFTVTAEDGTTTREWSVEVIPVLLTPMDSPAPLQPLFSGSVVLADLDRDGDLDIFLTGQKAGGQGHSSLLLNDGSLGFTLHPHVFLPLQGGDARAADFDLDGFLDIVQTGMDDGSDVVAFIHYYEPATTSYNSFQNSAIQGVLEGEVSVADVDSSGYVDLLCSGSDGDGNVFSHSLENHGAGGVGGAISGLPPLEFGSNDLGDYDRDGNADLLFAGEVGDGSLSAAVYVFDPVGGWVVSPTTPVSLPGVRHGLVRWVDYDGDGFLDIFISGEQADSSTITALYRSDGLGGFADSGQTFLGQSHGDVAFPDFDGDGDTDLVLVGIIDGDPATIGYAQQDDHSFVVEPGIIFEDLNVESMAWGDLDDDGDLDAILIGRDGDGNPRSEIYLNRLSLPKANPAAPVNLTSTPSGRGDITLDWEANPGPGVEDHSFELYLSTTPAADDTWTDASGSSVSRYSYYLHARRGAYQDSPVTLLGLAPGIHYWTVRSVNARWQGGDVAIEEPFVILRGESDIKEFTLASPDGAVTQVRETVFDITAALITVDMYSVNSVVATFSLSEGATVTVESVPQTSGVTVNAFMESYVYSVVAQNGVDTKDWTVVVRPFRFLEIHPTEITPLLESSSVWGDINSDGTKEGLISGEDGSGNLVTLGYANNPGSGFLPSPPPVYIPGLKEASSVMFDLGGDGDLDMLIHGTRASDPGPGFEQFSALLVNRGLAEAIFDLSAHWGGVTGKVEKVLTGWFDDDIREDIIILKGNSAGTESVILLFLYQRDGTFLEITGPDFPAIYDMAIHDFDRDVVPELLISGKNSSGQAFLSTYDLSTGTFVQEKIVNDIDLFETSIAITDYDRDGSSDVILMGETSSALPKTLGFLYKTATGDFGVDAGHTLPDFKSTLLRVGDMDGDGMEDIVLMGYDSSDDLVFQLFMAVSTGGFSVLYPLIAPVTRGDFQLAEIDGDGYLDIIITGDLSGTGPSSRVYKNLFGDTLDSPPGPVTLDHTFSDDNELTLSWTLPGSADPTAFTYDIFIRQDASHRSESLFANTIFMGKRTRSAPGKVSVTSLTLPPLPSGRHFWTVQTINSAYSGSVVRSEVLILAPSFLSDELIFTPAGPFLEAQPVGTLVGSFGLASPTAPPLTHLALTYVPGISAGPGSHNHLFTIVGSDLQTAAIFDTDSPGSGSAIFFQVSATDSGGANIVKDFEIVLETIDDPNLLSISPNFIRENILPGSRVGQINVSGGVGPYDLSIQAVNGIPFDGSLFSIDSLSFLVVEAEIDYDAPNNHRAFEIEILVTDQAGSVLVDRVQIIVEDTDDAPFTQIVLAPNRVAENEPPGVVGVFTGTGGGGPIPPVTFEFTAPVAGLSIHMNELSTTQTFDFEALASPLDFNVRATDRLGVVVEQALQLVVTNVNEPPLILTLIDPRGSGRRIISVAPDADAGTLVGYLESTDIDAGAVHSYSLPARADIVGLDPGAFHHNDFFTLSGSTLMLSKRIEGAMLTAQDNLVVWVQVSDGEFTLTASFLIRVGEPTEVPTDITLYPDTVFEMQPAGTFVGLLRVVDPDDPGTPHSLTLATGPLGLDNNVFEIDSKNQLLTLSVIDFNSLDAAKTLIIYVRAVDPDLNFFEKAIPIQVLEFVPPIGELTLGSQTIMENQPPGTQVGRLIFVTHLTGDFLLRFPPTSMNPDNRNFMFAEEGGNTYLVALVSFDYESLDRSKSFIIEVEATDGGENRLIKTFVISVSNVNEPPTSFELSNLEVAERQDVGTLVGLFTTVDPDAGGGHRYRFVLGDFEDSNHLFSIESNALKTREVIDYEEQVNGMVRILVETDDRSGGELVKSFTIQIGDENDPPQGITLQAHEGLYNDMRAGRFVALLVATDVDEVDSHIFSLVDGEGSDDNEIFQIREATLVLAEDILDTPTGEVLSFRVRVEDKGGEVHEESFALTVEFALGSGAEDSGIHVYPNPFSERLFLSGTRRVPLDLSLYDLVGNLLLEIKDFREDSFSTQGLQEGVYLLNLSGKGIGSFGLRVIKVGHTLD